MKKLSDMQLSKMIRHTAMKPADKKRAIEEKVRKCNGIHFF